MTRAQPPAVVFADLGISFCRMGRRGGRVTLYIADYLEDAPQDVIDDIVRFMLSGRGCAPPDRFNSYIQGEEFVVAKRPLFLERSRRFANTTVGEHRDLSDSVRRLLAAGLLDEEDVRGTYLTWSKRRAVRTLGTTYGMFRVVSISRALDSPDVREECLDFVVYHEFLHIRMGIRAGHRSHTKGFRDLERMFPDHERIQMELGRLRRRRSSRYTAVAMAEPWKERKAEDSFSIPPTGTRSSASRTSGPSRRRAIPEGCTPWLWPIFSDGTRRRTARRGTSSWRGRSPPDRRRP